MDEMLHSTFSSALDDICDLNPMVAEIMPLTMGFARSVLRKNNNFYLPGDAGLLDGKRLTDEMKETFRLPYECVSLLSPLTISDYHGGPQKGLSKKITVALEKDVKPCGSHGWMLLSIALHPDMKRWVPDICAVNIEYPSDYSGMKISLAFEDEFIAVSEWLLKNNVVARGKSHRDIFDSSILEINCDIAAMQNLCTLLSLNNVSTEINHPPEKLNKKRLRSGKLPLQAYKTLVINAGKNNEKLGGIGAAHGVRSHLRRGHIRRLDEDRRIWVNSCLVTGSVPGFVKKDYVVKGSAEIDSIG